MFNPVATGKKLVVADLSNIEGRMLAFLSGEEWKLQAFRDFDTCLGADGNWYTGDELRDSVLARNPIQLALDKKGEPTRKGHDLYALAYAKSFNVSPEAVMANKKSGDGSWRQIGKVQELALGYEGGVGAFITFSLAYGIDLDDMAAKAGPNIPRRVWVEAERAWEWATEKKRTYGLKKETYIVCDSLKRLWREAHPATRDFWCDLEFAFRKAIENPGKVYNVADPDFQAISREINDWKRSPHKHRRPSLRVVRSGAWVRIVLPSGRSLCYPSAKVDDKGKISYQGINQFSRQWCRLKTYSGKLAENVTQAASRDVLKASEPAIEEAGYDILIPVHDELITEAPNTPEFNCDHLAGLMATNPEWAIGLPLAAAGFEAMRYRKD